MQLLADHWVQLLLMAGLLLCSAFFSGTETALFSLTREQIKRVRAQKKHGEKLLSILANNPSGLLTAILFGNLLVNILFFSTSAVIATDIGQQHGEGWAAAAGISVLLLIILCGEIFPKAAGLSSPERIVQLNASLLRGWYLFLGPVRRALEAAANYLEPADRHDNQLNAEELKMLIDATQHDPTFGTQEKAIVEDIITLPEIRIRELMVPRVKQMLCNVNTPILDALNEAAEMELKHIPIFEGTEENIIGTVDVRDLFVSNAPHASLAQHLHPAHFAPETKRADEMLREFLAADLRIVCVVDEYGGLAGTIGLEDLLEEVVGEFDAMELPPIEQLGESTYRLNGDLSIREWHSLFAGFLPEATRTRAADTVSGLVISLLKRMPKRGDTVRIQNLKFTVNTIRRNRIESVTLELSNAKGAETS